MDYSINEKYIASKNINNLFNYFIPGEQTIVTWVYFFFFVNI